MSMELKVQGFFRAYHSVVINGEREESHRHRFVVEVTVEGEPVDGVVLDFLKIDQALRERVIHRFNGTHLNDFFENPTAENLAREIFRLLQDVLTGPNYRLKAVTLWESPRYSVTYRP